MTILIAGEFMVLSDVNEGVCLVDLLVVEVVGWQQLIFFKGRMAPLLSTAYYQFTPSHLYIGISIEWLDRFKFDHWQSLARMFLPNLVLIPLSYLPPPTGPERLHWSFRKVVEGCLSFFFPQQEPFCKDTQKSSLWIHDVIPLSLLRFMFYWTSGLSKAAVGFLSHESVDWFVFVCVAFHLFPSSPININQTTSKTIKSINIPTPTSLHHIRSIISLITIAP